MIQITKEERREKRRHVRDLLRRQAALPQRVERLERERAALRRQVEDARQTLRSPNMSGMPKGGRSTDLSDVVVGVTRAEEMYQWQSEHINAEIQRMFDESNLVKQCLSQLSPIEEEVIINRYTEKRKWCNIGIKMGYDESTVKKIEAAAVDKIGCMMAV